MKTEVTLLWTTTMVILLAGYLGIVQPRESAIHTSAASSTMLSERIARMEDILRNESALQEAHERVVQQLSRVMASGHGAQDGAFLLHSIATEARRAGVAILSIAPGSVEQLRHSIMSRDLLMSVRGPYRSTIAFLPYLSLTDPLLEIQSVAVHTQEQSSSKQLPSVLRVDITARLYRIVPSPLSGR